MPVYSKEVQGKLKTAPHLEIKLVKCNDLASKDPNGLSDPYVKFKVGGHKLKSAVKKKTLNPEYNETFYIYVPSTITDFEIVPQLHVEVIDWDMIGKNDFIGGVSIPLASMESDVSYRKYLTLKPAKTGFIELVIIPRNIPAQIHRTPQIIKCTKPNAQSMQELLQQNSSKEVVLEDKSKKNYAIDSKSIASVQAKFEDSNVFAIGTQEDIEQRINAAKGEDAWDGAGKEEGIEIWRIEKFAVKKWPKESYGQFYDGDSFIVLNTHRNPQNESQLLYDVHFWLGLHSSQDEIGTAAYKTVELDDLLGSLPVEHREVQGFETDMFLSYFPTLQILNGGIDSGFNAVDWRASLNAWEPKLFWVKGKGSTISVRQVPLETSSLNSGDVFVLDLGLKAMVWKGKSSSKTEQFKATTLCTNMQNDRASNTDFNYYFIEEGNYENSREEHEFWAALKGTKDQVRTSDEGIVVQLKEKKHRLKLFRISDSTGHLVFSLVSENVVKRSDLDSMDAFLLDVGDKLFVWVGSNASVAERKNSMNYASIYAKEVFLPLTTPIIRVSEGIPHPDFDHHFQ